MFNQLLTSISNKQVEQEHIKYCSTRYFNSTSDLNSTSVTALFILTSHEQLLPFLNKKSVVYVIFNYLLILPLQSTSLIAFKVYLITKK